MLKTEQARQLAVNELQGLRRETDQQISGMLADLAIQMSSQSNPIGQNMIQGIIEGANNKSSALQSTLQNLAHQALQAAKVTLGINSPSRAFRVIGINIGDGLIIGIKSKIGEITSYCKLIADKVKDSLYIDPTKLIENAKDVLNSMQVALPALESNMQYTTGPQTALTTATPTLSQAPITFTFGDVYVREENDIDKIVNKILRKLDKEVNYNGKVKGVRMV